MARARRTVVVALVGSALAAGGGAALAASQQGGSAHPAKLVPARPAAAVQHHCPHMGMASDTASSSNL